MHAFGLGVMELIQFQLVLYQPLCMNGSCKWKFQGQNSCESYWVSNTKTYHRVICLSISILFTAWFQNRQRQCAIAHPAN